MRWRCDDAQRYSADGRYAPLMYRARETYIRIGVKGINVMGHPRAWYKVAHEGSGTEPSIEQVALKDIKRLVRGKASSQTEGTS